MNTEKRELSIINQGAHVLAELSVRIGFHFRRAEARNSVGHYLHELLRLVERKNGWQLIEEIGESNVHGVQRMLAEADWDEEVVCDDLWDYVIEQLAKWVNMATGVDTSVSGVFKQVAMMINRRTKLAV